MTDPAKAICENCGRRIYEQKHGRYGLKVWHHANGDQHCAELDCKYAEPRI